MFSKAMERGKRSQCRRSRSLLASTILQRMIKQYWTRQKAYRSAWRFPIDQMARIDPNVGRMAQTILKAGRTA